MIDLGFDKSLSAGDPDAVLTDELRGGDVVSSEGFGDERHCAGRTRIGRLNGDLVEKRFVIKCDGLGSPEVAEKSRQP